MAALTLTTAIKAVARRFIDDIRVLAKKVVVADLDEAMSTLSARMSRCAGARGGCVVPTIAPIYLDWFSSIQPQVAADAGNQPR